DNISDGRAVLGIGSGWQEREHTAYGIEYDTVPGRLKRLEEAVQVLRSLFDNPVTNFNGRDYNFLDAPLLPQPAQAHPPSLIGGGGKKVTLRIAAEYADEWNVWGTPDVFAQKTAILEQHCNEVGRDPKTIRRLAQTLIVFGDDAELLNRSLARGRFPEVAGSV